MVIATKGPPMHDAGDFFVKFWGVRGSIASADPGTARYGGNTSSLEVRCGDRLLLLDGGTGLRYLGRELSMNGPVATRISTISRVFRSSAPSSTRATNSACMLAICYRR
jgi:hypothetical protein